MLYVSENQPENGEQGFLFDRRTPEKIRILVLSDRVEACRKWVERLRLEGIPAGLMVGGPANRKELDETITGLKYGTLSVGVGTSVADEGLDIPPLTHVLVTCPTHKHRKRLEQMIGRAARLHDDKEEAVCVYFWDWHMFPNPEQGESSVSLLSRRKKFLKDLGKAVDTVELPPQFTV